MERLHVAYEDTEGNPREATVDAEDGADAISQLPDYGRRAHVTSLGAPGTGVVPVEGLNAPDDALSDDDKRADLGGDFGQGETDGQVGGDADEPGHDDDDEG